MYLYSRVLSKPDLYDQTDLHTTLQLTGLKSVCILDKYRFSFNNTEYTFLLDVVHISMIGLYLLMISTMYINLDGISKV